MGWIRHGVVWEDDGQHSDWQAGAAASVRFANPDLPGRAVTVYAYPYAPEKSVITKDGSIETFHGFTHDMDGLKVETQTWYEIDPHPQPDVFQPEWSEIKYDTLDLRTYSGTAKQMIADAETDAVGWIRSLDPEQYVNWNGEEFHG